jgi:hypothetical protein
MKPILGTYESPRRRPQGNGSPTEAESPAACSHDDAVTFSRKRVVCVMKLGPWSIEVPR